MTNPKSCNGRSGSLDQDEEFVVPHMEISCTLNSVAYMRVLEEPWLHIHNWECLNMEMQKAATQSLFDEAQDIKNFLKSSEPAFVLSSDSVNALLSPASCGSAPSSAESDQQQQQEKQTVREP